MPKPTNTSNDSELSKLLEVSSIPHGDPAALGQLLFRCLRVVKPEELLFPIQQLLKLGANVDARDVDTRNSKGATVLHCAAERGLVDVARILLARGADVNATDEERGTPLHHAARAVDLSCETTKHDQVIALLLEKGATINYADIEGRTALHSAAAKMHANTTLLLLKNRADVGAIDQYNMTPLDFLVMVVGDKLVPFGKEELAKMITLLQRFGGRLNANLVNNIETLLKATREGDAYIVQTLLDLGLSSNVRRGGKTALHYAVENKHEGVAALLLARGANVDAEDDNGERGLGYALNQRHVGITALLLAKGARIAVDQFNMTPLDFLVMKAGGKFPSSENDDLIKIASLLQEYGAVLSSTPEHFKMLRDAIRHNDTASMTMLLSSGLSSNYASPKGTTLLHSAVKSEHVAPVELLLKRGANIDAIDGHGKTALHRAVARGHLDITETLLKYGAEVSDDYEELFDLAKKEPKMLKILKDDKEKKDRERSKKPSSSLETATASSTTSRSQDSSPTTSPRA